MDNDKGEEPLRATLQDALARANASVDDSSAKARRWLAAHPWPGRATLAPIGEPGDRMVVSGVVRDAAGQPLAGAKLHLFHADASGHYRAEKAMDEPHARLNGWILTGADGRYEFESVRPGGYPQPRGDVAADAGDARWIPQHVHVEIETPGREPRRFQMVFADDPRMTPHWQKWAKDGENPVLTLVKDEQGVLRGVCDVTLK
jgi:protocatechuate 3,4-dioxygenase beta subunit